MIDKIASHKLDQNMDMQFKNKLSEIRKLKNKNYLKEQVNQTRTQISRIPKLPISIDQPHDLTKSKPNYSQTAPKSSSKVEQTSFHQQGKDSGSFNASE